MNTIILLQIDLKTKENRENTSTTELRQESGQQAGKFLAKLICWIFPLVPLPSHKSVQTMIQSKEWSMEYRGGRVFVVSRKEEEVNCEKGEN